MIEIHEVQQLMDRPPGLRSATVHAARQRLMRAAAPPARTRRRLVVGLVAGASAAAAAVGAFAAAGPGPKVQTATLTAWTVHRDAADAVTVTIRQFRDPAGLQRSLSAAGVPALVQFGPRPCPFPFQAIPGNAAMIGRVLIRGVPMPGGVAFTIHPSAIPSGTSLDIVFPYHIAGGDKLKPTMSGLLTEAPSPPMTGSASAIPHPVAIRLIPTSPQCVQPAPNPSAS